MSRVVAALLLGLSLVAFASSASAGRARTNGLIAFDATGADGTNDDIFVVGADGSGLTNLTETTADEEEPVWSPDGTRMAFRLAADGTAQGDVAVAAPDGTGIVDLTPDPADEFLPQWSPDGTRIAFLLAPAKLTKDHIGDLVVINADGTGLKQLTTGAPVDDDTFDWSPDSTRLVFGGQKGRLMVVRADGTGLHRVRTPGQVLHPAWSPNGKRIAFAGSPLWERGAGIWTVTTAGKAAKRVTRSAFGNDYEPTWSPDGARIAFQREAAGPNALYVVRAAGGAVHALSRGLALGDNPVWSPDGRRITFVGGGKRDPVRELFVVDADGSHRRQLTHGADVNLASWQPLP